MELAIIVAVAQNGVIGDHGRLPWRLSSDLRRFKRLTWGCPIIMGRHTYDSIGRPLPGRHSIVLTHRPLLTKPVTEGGRLESAAGNGTVETVSSWEEALQRATDSRSAFVIGGRSVYQLALPLADRLYWTAVQAEVAGDVTFPAIDWNRWRKVQEQVVPAGEKDSHATLFQQYVRVRA